jgi:hypothetical protein
LQSSAAGSGSSLARRIGTHSTQHLEQTQAIFFEVGNLAKGGGCGLLPILPILLFRTQERCWGVSSFLDLKATSPTDGKSETGRFKKGFLDFARARELLKGWERLFAKNFHTLSKDLVKRYQYCTPTLVCGRLIQLVSWRNPSQGRQQLPLYFVKHQPCARTPAVREAVNPRF